MTAARDDVRSALITAGAERCGDETKARLALAMIPDGSGFADDDGVFHEGPTAGAFDRAVAQLDHLPRPLLLRFAWEGLSDEERAGYVATAREALANVARTWELSEDIAFALDAALMTGGEDV